MLPIGDDNEHSGFAFVTIALIVVNVIAFLNEINRPEQAVQAFIFAWGVVPREYAAGIDLPPTIPLPYWSTMVTSMFLHGGWAHLGGNMLFLWIFGDNVEDAMGHFGYLVFYLVCGLVATFAQIAINLDSPIPGVGASGAIAGVLGAYLILFPQAQVRVLAGYYGIIRVPALVMIGLWF